MSAAPQKPEKIYREYSREFLTEAITLYKQFPCLWKAGEETVERRFKQAAWDTMWKKFKEIDENIKRAEVMKKMNNLRTGWRKEKKKMLAFNAHQLLNTTDEAVPGYYPRLWYFDLLSYIEEKDPLAEAQPGCIEEPLESDGFETVNVIVKDEDLDSVEDFIEILSDSRSDISEVSEPEAKRLKADSSNKASSSGVMMQSWAPDEDRHNPVDADTACAVSQSAPGEDSYDPVEIYVADTACSPQAVTQSAPIEDDPVGIYVADTACSPQPVTQSAPIEDDPVGIYATDTACSPQVVTQSELVEDNYDPIRKHVADTACTLKAVTQSAPVEDCYDHFGKYIASMLRTIGSPDAIMLQQEITMLVTNRMCASQE